MTCPECGSDNSRCVDSRQRALTRRRRYECIRCGARFSTVEIWEERMEESRKRILQAAQELAELTSR
jgi:transcriptional regulator NrdR family protein